MRKETATAMTFSTMPAATVSAQGWDEGYDGVMLQPFCLDSYTGTDWTTLEAWSDEFFEYVDPIRVPGGGYCTTGGLRGTATGISDISTDNGCAHFFKTHTVDGKDVKASENTTLIDAVKGHSHGTYITTARKSFCS